MPQAGLKMRQPLLFPSVDDFDTHEEWESAIQEDFVSKRAVWRLTLWLFVVAALVFSLTFEFFPRYEVQVVRDSRYSYVVVHDRWTGTVITRDAYELAQNEWRWPDGMMTRLVR